MILICCATSSHHFLSAWLRYRLLHSPRLKATRLSVGMRHALTGLAGCVIGLSKYELGDASVVVNTESTVMHYGISCGIPTIFSEASIWPMLALCKDTVKQSTHDTDNNWIWFPTFYPVSDINQEKEEIIFTLPLLLGHRKSSAASCYHVVHLVIKLHMSLLWHGPIKHNFTYCSMMINSYILSTVISQ